jgi:galactokinase
MFDKRTIAQSFAAEAAKEEFKKLYGGGEDVYKDQAARYEELLDEYADRFGCAGEAPAFFSAPGRTEIVGNHTDHNNGLVLAAAVTLDTLAAAAPTSDGVITLYSAGYEQPFVVDTRDLEMRQEEMNTTQALIRGVCRKLRDMGYSVGGFNAAVTSRVLGGSGLSSSAAFEVMLVCVLDGLYNGGILDGVTRAKISQWVENRYFGKPSGLMDQSASSIGGLVGIDFKMADPKIEALSFDFEARGFNVVVLATNSSHGDLTQEYAAIPEEMRAVARALGGSTLRNFKVEQLLSRLPEIRQATSDRAVLRALHYYDENERVKAILEAVRAGDLDAFLSGVIASGESSWKLLQNLYVGGSDQQSLALACALSERMLKGCGAWRVHGGGFAGTILAFVPHYKLETYVATMDQVFGKGACTVLGIRPVGAKKVDL